MPLGTGVTGSRRGRLLVGAWAALSLPAMACSESPDSVESAQRQVTRAEQEVADAEAALEQAGSEFCGDAQDYIVALDNYGKLLDEATATVGDVRALGADLQEPRDSTAAAAQAVLDSHEALNNANEDLLEARATLKEAKASASPKPGKQGKSPSPAPISSPTVPPASVDRVEVAESDLEAASEGITDQTPVVEAAESFNSAAFALEVAWINLFLDAGCLGEEESTQAAAAIRQYAVALQSDLKAAGYLDGEVDGVYGPATTAAVEALQEEAGLPVTGYVDLATREALDEALAKKGQSAANQAQVEAASVQTVLKLAGFWDGPIDGEWTPELEAALKDFQKELGVEQTGAVDATTLSALEELLVTIQTQASPSPTSSS